MAFTKQTFTAFIGVGYVGSDRVAEELLMKLAQAIVDRVFSERRVLPVSVGIDMEAGIVAITFEDMWDCDYVVRKQNAVEKEWVDGQRD